MDMTPQRWENTANYLHEVFGHAKGGDKQLDTLMTRAVAAGLPDIAVSAEVGQLLKILSMMATRDPRARGAILELGTLAGYSGIWLARGLPTTGRLITVEFAPKHAAFAQREFEQAGLAKQVRVVTAAALDALPSLSRELGAQSLDLAFIDAIKTEYPEYLRHIKPLLRPGGLLVVDNALGSNSWWIDSEPGPERDAVDRFNRMVAEDPDFDAACVPIRQGVLIARRTDVPR